MSTGNIGTTLLFFIILVFLLGAFAVGTIVLCIIFMFNANYMLSFITAFFGCLISYFLILKIKKIING